MSFYYLLDGSIFDDLAAGLHWLRFLSLGSLRCIPRKTLPNPREFRLKVGRPVVARIQTNAALEHPAQRGQCSSAAATCDGRNTATHRWLRLRVRGC